MTSEANRVVGQRRKAGVCWCCATAAPVRPCSFWLDGIVRPLCKQCEGEQAVSKPSPRPQKPKPTPTVPEQLIAAWAERRQITALGMLADWYEARDLRPDLIACVRRILERGHADDVWFFYQHAGSGSNPERETEAEGRFHGACNLASAEHWLAASYYEARWVQDEDYDPSDYDYPGVDDAGEVQTLGWGCVIECQCQDCLLVRQRRPRTAWPHPGESLWSITFEGDGYPDGKPYKRLVEAELALELMPD